MFSSIDGRKTEVCQKLYVNKGYIFFVCCNGDLLNTVALPHHGS